MPRSTPRVAAVLLCSLLAAPAGAQTLQVQGDRFAIDGQPRFLLLISYFDAMRASSASLGADFEYFKTTLRFDGIRIMPNWSGNASPSIALFRSDGTLPPANDRRWTKFVEILDTASARGLVVDVTFTRETYPAPLPIPAYRQAIVDTAARLATSGGYRHVMFDVQNEYDNHGLKDGDIGRIVSAVHQADPERITFASKGAMGLPSVPSLDVFSLHDRFLDRHNAEWFTDTTMAGHITCLRGTTCNVPPIQKPIYFQEPVPFNRVVPGKDFDSSATHHRQAAKWASAKGAAAWLFHNRESFDLTDRSLKMDILADTNWKNELMAVRSTVDEDR